MVKISLFPKWCLTKLNELSINYFLINETKNFCEIEINEKDYEKVYNIGLKRHLELLFKIKENEHDGE